MSDIVWSVSKADTAAQCLYKYKRVYVDKKQLVGHALTLGTKAHSIQADELVAGRADVVALQKSLDNTSISVDPECGPEIYQMLPNISNFVSKWKEIESKYAVKPTIEQQYAITRDGKQTKFLAKDAYFRGVIDLWGFSESQKKLIVIDHKTNKNLSSENAVKGSSQLKMYVWMLTKIHGFEWERAHIALHFLRHGKMVWAGLTNEEANESAEQYLGFLSVLEDRVHEAEENNDWTKQPCFFCKWCQFQRECDNPLDAVQK